MKQRLQGIVIGVLFSMLILNTVTVIASTRRVDITYGVNVVVNGITQHFTDDMRPFIAEGRTFLPVGAIANALGLEARWDGATSTVYLNNHTTIPTLHAPTIIPSTEPTNALQINYITISQNRSQVLRDRAVTFYPISFESGNLRYTLIGADFSHIDGGGNVSLNTVESIGLSIANGFQRTIFTNRDLIGTRDRQLRLYFMVEPSLEITSARDMPSANLHISAQDNTGTPAAMFFNSLTEGHPTFETPLHGMVVFALFSDDKWIDIELGGRMYRLMLNIIPMIVDWK